ncbi:merozoite TRAP-like protein, putative [Plasmodium berghei]|uniref:Merozoite TRAP-like protein, putative n=1 Tax=Plasmodium berghei TaxID=5821 RepID=A0A0Y9UVF1_PLABE|nr:merozoite TRAP-like protein, putative [Plasmodium berghei]SCM17558.1 merozoite TRAP-like protein, putative [Plasmodium berghei]
MKTHITTYLYIYIIFLILKIKYNSANETCDNWGPWGPCSNQITTRTCLTNTSLIEKENCSQCKEWSEWLECKDGKRSRHIINCPFIIETQDCITDINGEIVYKNKRVIFDNPDSENKQGKYNSNESIIKPHFLQSQDNSQPVLIQASEQKAPNNQEGGTVSVSTPSSPDTSTDTSTGSSNVAASSQSVGSSQSVASSQAVDSSQGVSQVGKGVDNSQNPKQEGEGSEKANTESQEKSPIAPAEGQKVEGQKAEGKIEETVEGKVEEASPKSATDKGVSGDGVNETDASRADASGANASGTVASEAVASETVASGTVASGEVVAKEGTSDDNAAGVSKEKDSKVENGGSEEPSKQNLPEGVLQVNPPVKQPPEASRNGEAANNLVDTGNDDSTMRSSINQIASKINNNEMPSPNLAMGNTGINNMDDRNSNLNSMGIYNCHNSSMNPHRGESLSRSSKFSGLRSATPSNCYGPEGSYKDVNHMNNPNNIYGNSHRSNLRNDSSDENPFEYNNENNRYDSYSTNEPPESHESFESNGYEEEDYHNRGSRSQYNNSRGYDHFNKLYVASGMGLVIILSGAIASYALYNEKNKQSGESIFNSGFADIPASKMIHEDEFWGTE